MTPVQRPGAVPSFRWKETLRRVFRTAIGIVPHTHSLPLLALKYWTDKRAHGYLEHYEQHFAPLRHRKLTILEIGIGGYNEPDKGGGSLRMWRDYFPHSMVYGLDIEDKSRLAEQRIGILRGDQSDEDFLHDMARRLGPFDIIIDDGSHINAHVRTSFDVLFPYLHSGGIYAIEDLHTAYMPSYGGSDSDLHTTTTSIAMLKDLVDGLHHAFIAGRTPGITDTGVVSLHLYPKLAFIIKGHNDGARKD